MRSGRTHQATEGHWPNVGLGHYSLCTGSPPTIKGTNERGDLHPLITPNLLVVDVCEVDVQRASGYCSLSIVSFMGRSFFRTRHSKLYNWTGYIVDNDQNKQRKENKNKDEAELSTTTMLDHGDMNENKARRGGIRLSGYDETRSVPLQQETSGGRLQKERKNRSAW